MKKNLFVLVITVMLVMAGCGSKPTLAQLVESDDVVAGEEETNAALAEAGLGIRFEYSADGTVIYSQEYVDIN